DAQLAELERAFGLARSGRAVLTIVRGPSGIGRTARVRTVVGQVVAEDRAVVRAGRCYVRESMPYKGLDGVIDSLTRFLRTLADRDLDRLITRDLATVLHLFPVLGRVPKLLQLPTPERDVVDPVELRRQRFSALQGLFRRIAAEKPVVVHIDDLQWGDADSILLLDSLLGPPDPPALLVIASLSSEDTASPPPFLRTLLGRTGPEACRELRLSGLSGEDERGPAHVRPGGRSSRAGRACDSRRWRSRDSRSTPRWRATWRGSRRTSGSSWRCCRPSGGSRTPEAPSGSSCTTTGSAVPWRPGPLPPGRRRRGCVPPPPRKPRPR